MRQSACYGKPSYIAPKLSWGILGFRLTPANEVARFVHSRFRNAKRQEV